jgi:N utilization substance protein B
MNLEGRRGARRAALQILYQWEIGGAALDDTLATYWDVREHDPVEGAPGAIDAEYAARLARGTVEHLADIDPLLEAQAENWRLSRMAVVDRLILRLAAYELRHEPDSPPAVVINEALELARTFSSEEAVPFINGVLDGIAKRGIGSREDGSRREREGERDPAS